MRINLSREELKKLKEKLDKEVELKKKNLERESNKNLIIEKRKLRANFRGKDFTHNIALKRRMHEY